MTQTPADETVRSTAARRNRPQGLTIERVFSEAGRHPYDTVTWERRDVVQSNWKTGETVFEQRGVEFPESWMIGIEVVGERIPGTAVNEQHRAAVKNPLPRQRQLCEPISVV